jgi:WD40 repeat protein
MRVWDLDTGKPLRTLAGHDGEVEAVAATADGRRAVSGHDDGTVRVWDLANGKRVVPASQRLWRSSQRLWHWFWGPPVFRNSPVHVVAVSEDGRRAVAGGRWDGTVRVWDLDTGRRQAELSGHDGPVHAVAVTADGRRAVSGGHAGTVRVWDLEKGVELAFFAADSGITKLAVTAAGTRVIAGASTGPVHLLELRGYDYASGQPPAQEPRP